jgi:hypothetical protein
MKDDEMPRRINTVEKPATNAEEFTRVSFLIKALSAVLKSSKEIPVI